jgi:hypothetical protein
MTQRAEFTFEIEETVVLKQGGCCITEYCPRCREMVDMVSPDVLSLITGVSEREIFRLVEAGAIHFVETSRVVACPSCYRHMLAYRSAELVLSRSDISENEE